jgi:hypothetical protein
MLRHSLRECCATPSRPHAISRICEKQARLKPHTPLVSALALSHVLWQARLDEFAQTWYGKATIIVALGVVLSLPITWKLINILLLLW